MAGSLIFLIVVVVIGCMLAARACLRAVRRYWDRRRWNDLVARHQELDRELEKIWQLW